MEKIISKMIQKQVIYKEIMNYNITIFIMFMITNINNDNNINNRKNNIA